MEQNNVHALDNPNLVNNMVDQAMAVPEKKVEPAKIIEPFSNLVNLPGGFILPSGEVARVGEVRELNGRDEEAISKVPIVSRIFITILSRAVVRLGNRNVTEEDMDSLLAGDRDALLLGVYIATFGPEAEFTAYCDGCRDTKTVMVNLTEDIKTRALVDPLVDRSFIVQGKKHEFLVTLPTGKTQKELSSDTERTLAELNSVLLESCVLQIDGEPIMTKQQIKNIGLVDRRTIVEEIYNRNPGPQFDPIKISCPQCSGEVVVPINLGALFQL
jgi:hypothetical protein